MIVNIQKIDLHNMLQIARSVAPQKPTVPVLSYGLLQAEEGKRLALVTTDLDQVVSISRDAEVIESGKILVPIKLLAQFVYYLPQGTIELTYRDSTLFVKQGVYEAEFKCLEDIVEFPGFSEPTPSQSRVDLSRSLLANGLKFTIFAAATDPTTRPALTVVNFDFDGVDLAFVSADGFRMSIYRTVLDSPICPQSVLVPASALGNLQRILKIKGSYSVSMDWNDTKAIFQVFDRDGRIIGYLISPRLSDRYPDYEMILPKTCNTHVKVANSRLLFRACLVAETTTYATMGGKCRVVRLQIGEGVSVAGRSDMAKSNIGLDIPEVGGDQMEIAFRSSYLKDMLKAIGTKYVVMEFVSPSSPAVFRTVVAEDQFIHCLMPMHISA